MSKKQFDHIENKIREAAENSEPAFEEQAWDKMEAKLNAEKERKWNAFLWFSVAFLSIGLVGRVIVYHNQSSQKTAISQNITTVIKSDKNADQSASAVNTNLADNKELLSTNHNKVTIDPKDNSHQNNQTVGQKSNNNSKETSSSYTNNVTNQSAEKHYSSIEKKNKTKIVNYNNNDAISESDRTSEGNNSIEKNISDKKVVFKNISAKKSSEKKSRKAHANFVSAYNNQVAYSSSQKNERRTTGRTSAKIRAGAQADATTDSIPEDNEIAASYTDNDKSISSIDKEKKKDSAQKILPKDTSTVASSKKEVKKEDTLPKKKNWYLLASIGPDASNVKLLSFKNNVITPRYGVGIGYQINKHFSVQTGFYAGRKKYVAGPDDYNDAKDPYLNSMNINKVEANCLIFDIPVTVRYNFILRPKTTFFATAGISSFIMKKEDYDYYYTAYNNNYEASHSYTGNKNLFSIAAISVGVERKISKTFSIQAEPSVNIPITAGVGEGTVKLYSTDIQLGVKYNFRW